MRQLEFYEFAGVLVPGALLLVGLAFLFRQIAQPLAGTEFGAGDFGIFVLLAYVAGQLVQAVGNLVEWLWWKPWGGQPTNWPRAGHHRLLSTQQREQLRTRLAALLDLPASGNPFQLPEADWKLTIRQVDAAVRGAGKGARVETLNGNYGLNRGIAASFLVLLVIALASRGPEAWEAGLLLGGAAAVAVYRMHRFGRHYAIELFLQFLSRSQTQTGVCDVG
jgi:hypothetical protein